MESSLPVRAPSWFAERLAALGLVGTTTINLLREWGAASPGALLIGFVSVMVVGGTFAWWRRRPRKCDVQLDATHVHLVDARGRRRSFPRSALAHAEIGHRKEGGTTLRVLDRRRAVLFALDLSSSAEVEEWIRRLGLDRGARELAVQGRLLTVGAVEMRAFAAAYAVLAIASFVSLSSTASFMSLLPLAIFTVVRGSLLVGLDGVEERRLARRRFYPMAEIADVEKVDKKIHLVLKDGRKVQLAVSDLASDAALRDDIEWTIRRALVDHRAAQSEHALETLARGDREVREWLDELEVLSRGGDYRRGALSVERLAATVRDPSADPSARAGAAWILARLGSPEPAREARAHAAHPKVRVALDAAMDGDVEALDHATRAPLVAEA